MGSGGLPFHDFLKDINKSLPNLRVLSLVELIGKTSIEVSQQTVDSLGRLSKSLYLFVNNNSFQNKIKTKVMKNCKKLKSINIGIDFSYINDSFFNFSFNCNLL